MQISKAFFILLTCCFISCNKKKPEQQGCESIGKPEIEFKNTYFDFGLLEAGEEASYSFKFTNTGNANLKIDSVVTDCGCLVVTHTKAPIEPNSYNYIDLLLSTHGEVGQMYKEIKVYNNSNKKPSTLRIIAKVNNSMFNF